MLMHYDPEAGGVIYVRLRVPHEGRLRGRRVDERRIIHTDDTGEVAAVEFLFVDQGVDLTGIPNAEEIAEALRSIARVRVTAAA